MKDILFMLCYCMMVASLFGFAAYLIKYGVAGWGWYLFAVVLFLSETSWSVKP